MTPEEHKKRHEELHKALDELVADFITYGDNTNGNNVLVSNLPSQTSVMKLMEWSHRQTVNLTHGEKK